MFETAWGAISHLPDWFLFAIVPWLIFSSLYFGLGFLLLPLDFWKTLNAKIRHVKCQPERSASWEDVGKILKTTVPQIFTLYPLASLLSVSFLKSRLSLKETDLPSFSEFLYSSAIFLLCSEIFFYYNHRLLHHKSFYAYVHKKHHEFTSPIALECVYFHPYEALTNFGVVGLGPILMKSHVVMLYWWTFAATMGILIHHCGYEVPGDGFPGLLNSMSHFHDFHHKYYNKAFGVIGLCDWIHNTGYEEYHVPYHQEWKLEAGSKKEEQKTKKKQAHRANKNKNKQRIK